VMGSSRVVGVLCGQAAGSGVLDQIVNDLADSTINPNHIKMDAGATAPYFSTGGRDAGWSAGLKATCQRANLRMLQYECGTETGKGPALYTLYTSTLSNFQSDGFECYNAFTAIAGWGAWGNWGHMEYVGQPLDSAYKYKALWDFAIANKTFDPNAAIPGCGAVSGVSKLPQQGAVLRSTARLQLAGVTKYNIRGQIITGSSDRRGSAGIILIGSKGDLHLQVKMAVRR
jgi:hypothetical protein